MVDNIIETDFIVKFDNVKTLGFIGSEDIKYSDAVSCRMGITTLVITSGGSHSFTESPFIIFQNKDSNYPIENVPGNVPGVSYLTQHKFGIGRQLFLDWLIATRAISKYIHGRERVIFLNNFGGQKKQSRTQKQLKKFKFSLLFFLCTNSTDLCHPCEVFL